MRLLRFFFRQLYGTYAWAYDFIADLVSFGRWKDLIQVVLPYLGGTHILELGHGPGHLQHMLLDRNFISIGIDRSSQMGKIAKKRLIKYGYAQYMLTSADAKKLPFQDESFDTIFTTFPTEYFNTSLTLSEAWRTLKNGGRYVVLPVAWVTGNGILDRFAAWLFFITGQAPSDFSLDANKQLIEPFKDAGFITQVEFVDIKSSRVLIIIASKEEHENL